MDINFNQGKKELETEQQEQMISEDGEIITDFEEDTTDYAKLNRERERDEFKDHIKKLLMIMGVIVLVLILIFFLSSLFIKKKYTYPEIETVMENACKDYFKDYPNYLPKEENASRNVPVDNLVDGNYMKDLSSYVPDGVTCNGRVNVEKTSEDYDYRAYLNCGDTYKTIELAKKIANETPIVNSGYGLYNLHGNYVYRGEKVNNYLKLEQNLWRIVRVNSDETITLVLSDRFDMNSVQWDNRFNKVKGHNIGINNYSTSRVKENLAKMYKGFTDENGKKKVLLSDTDKTKLAYFDLCVGKRGSTETGNANISECKEKEVNQKVGLLTISDYMMASTDVDCKTALSANCMNYNYLYTDEYSFWFATADSANSFDVYCLDQYNGLVIRHANSSGRVRPVITLKANVFYMSGKGTKSNPYVIK